MKIKKTNSSLLPYIAFFLLSFVIYGNTINHEFVLDDKLIIEGNPLIKGGSEKIGEIFRTNYSYGKEQFNDGLYRPLNILIFNIEYSLWQFNPKGYHFISTLLYGLLLMAIYKLCLLLFHRNKPLISILIVLFFALHPIHTEVVANVKSMDEILALLFGTLAFTFYILWTNQNKKYFLILGMVMFALALLSKESIISFAFIIPFGLLYIKKLDIKKSLIVFTSLIIVSVPWMLWRSYVIDSMPTPPGEGSFSLLNNSLFGAESFIHQFANALWIQVLYIKQIILPYPLLHDYSYNTISLHALISWQSILTLFILVGIIYWIIKNFRSQKEIVFGFLFYLSSIFIVSNMFFLIGMTYAERFAFTPSLGIIISLVFLANKYFSFESTTIKEFFLQHKTIAFATTFILILFATLSIVRNQDWKSNLSLYEADVIHLNKSARANYNYGSALMEENNKLQAQKGIPFLKKAIEIYPDYIDAYNNLGVSYMNIKDYSAAIPVFNQLIQKDDNYSKAYFNLAFCYYQQKNYSHAIEWFKKLILIRNDFTLGYYYLAMCYGDQGNFIPAIEYLDKTIALQANHTDALLMRAKANGIIENFQQSLNDFNTLLKYKPNTFEAEFMTAVTLMNLNRTDEAIAYINLLDKKYPNNQDLLNLKKSIQNPN